MVKYIPLCSLQLLWGNSDSDCKRPLHHFQQGLDFLLSFPFKELTSLKQRFLYTLQDQKKKPYKFPTQAFQKIF